MNVVPALTISGGIHHTPQHHDKQSQSHISAQKNRERTSWILVVFLLQVVAVAEAELIVKANTQLRELVSVLLKSYISVVLIVLIVGVL